jgi:hypothetical protein
LEEYPRKNRRDRCEKDAAERRNSACFGGFFGGNDVLDDKSERVGLGRFSRMRKPF